MNEKKWYAVYTKPRWEKKVADLLSKKNIENYCPLNKVQKKWTDRKKIIFEPLFSCYVFARVSESEHILLKKTMGIINLVYWLGKPATIKEEEINIIRKFLNEYKNVKLEKVQVNVKDLVRVTTGPLMDCEGEIVSVRGKTLKVILPSMGYMMSAEIEINSVELIKGRANLHEEPKTSLEYHI